MVKIKPNHTDDLRRPGESATGYLTSCVFHQTYSFACVFHYTNSQVSQQLREDTSDFGLLCDYFYFLKNCVYFSSEPIYF
jgi:hypothetical protein